MGRWGVVEYTNIIVMFTNSMFMQVTKSAYGYQLYHFFCH